MPNYAGQNGLAALTQMYALAEEFWNVKKKKALNAYQETKDKLLRSN